MYTRPVLVRASIVVKIFFVATVTMCLVGGYLNEVDGPEGCNHVSLTLLSSKFRCNTQANHHFLSTMQVTNPEIDSVGRSSAAEVTLSSLQELDAENAFTRSLSFEIGINEWSLRVPGMVRAFINCCSRFFCSTS